MRTDEIAGLKIKALNSLIRSCRSKEEVDELLKIVPLLAEYVRLPGEPRRNEQRPR